MRVFWRRATSISKTRLKNARFREDLFYRLNVVELNVPPLRERREDILPLASHFITEFAKGRARFRTPWRRAWNSICGWQCARASQRDGAGGIAGAQRIDFATHLPTKVREAVAQQPNASPLPVDAQQLEEIERQAILQALRKHDYNRTETAKALGISRRALIYKLQRFRNAGF